MYLNICWVPTMCQVFLATLFSMNFSTNSIRLCRVLSHEIFNSKQAFKLQIQLFPFHGSSTHYLETHFLPLLCLLLLFIWICSLCFLKSSFCGFYSFIQAFLMPLFLLFSPVFYTCFLILLILYLFPSNHFPLDTGNPKASHYQQYLVKIHRLSILSIIPSYI